MFIYVAGKWEDRELIRKIHEELVSMGHTITCDWTNHTEHRHAVDYAIEDLEGVRQCDLLIAYMKKPYMYKGVWAEIGGALILNKPVLVIGDQGDSGIFINHPLVTRVNTITGAMKIVNFL